VEHDTAVGSVSRVAVIAPAAGPEVDLDIPTEEITARVKDGAGEVRPAPATGHTGKDDTQAAAIFQPQRRTQPSRPSRG
jgi:hypothetical protein